MSLTFLHAPRISAALFARVLARATSPAAAEAFALYDICATAGVDPAVFLAFFAHENQYGTVGITHDYDLKNPGSVRTPYDAAASLGTVETRGGTFAKYATWKAGTSDWCQRIRMRYVANGYDTVAKAIPKYAPAADNNNEVAYIAAVEAAVAGWQAEETATPMPISDGWYPGAKPIPVTGFWNGNRGRKAIVNHVIVGSIQSAINTFKSGDKSSHFGLAQNGDIYQFVSIWDSAWANGLSWIDGKWMDPEGTFVKPSWVGLEPGINPNLTTISIEHEGQSGDPWSAAMTASNNTLTAWIADQTGMHIEVHNTLIGHNEISPVNRAHCPGTGCDLFAIAAAVNSPAPKPTGPAGTFPVDPAFRDYYGRSGGLWQPDRYCLGWPITPLDPATKVQKFERGALRLRSDGGIDALLRSEW